jgi:hypothetical protein
MGLLNPSGDNCTSAAACANQLEWIDGSPVSAGSYQAISVTKGQMCFTTSPTGAMSVVDTNCSVATAFAVCQLDCFLPREPKYVSFMTRTIKH